MIEKINQDSMKVILSLSILGLIYLGSSLGLNRHLDIAGDYHPIKSQYKNEGALTLNPDGTFKYSNLFSKGIERQTTIQGKYTIKGNEVSLIIMEAASRPKLKMEATPKRQSRLRANIPQERKSNRTINPERFKKIQTAFEAGSLKIKPKYFFRLIKGKLSLCQKDIRKDQFNPVLTKK